MIRQYRMFCKVLTFKRTGGKSKGKDMPVAGKHSVTCPSCGSTGNCAAHGSYRRSLIDFEEGKVVYGVVEVQRVRCASCGHTHAILPDHIIPYTTYSLLFILRVLAGHFLGVGDSGAAMPAVFHLGVHAIPMEGAVPGTQRDMAGGAGGHGNGPGHIDPAAARFAQLFQRIWQAVLPESGAFLSPRTSGRGAFPPCRFLSRVH